VKQQIVKKKSIKKGKKKKEGSGTRALGNPWTCALLWNFFSLLLWGGWLVVWWVLNSSKFKPLKLMICNIESKGFHPTEIQVLELNH
jgi:hypothetical protein